jgi:hypothetical protein
MAAVLVLILHAEARPGAGPLEGWVAAARREIATRHEAAFTAAGAADVRILAGPPDDTPFGARLRGFVDRERPAGIVVLGSGSIPLATPHDRAALVAAAGSGEAMALANNRYSADVLAISCAEVLRRLPDLPADNALPRWLEEVAGYRVDELRRWRLGVDVDGPLDLVLLGSSGQPVAAPNGIDVRRVASALDRVAGAARSRRAELVLAGRTSARTLVWLERQAAARVRAIVEERGLRTAVAGQRPPRSVLGAVLDATGPAAVGSELARLGDAAVVDTRVLLAHRLGADERAWPSAEDRFASDLLLHERIADPWLRELTRAAAEAPIPIVLGGHTLVGPGLRLALAR